MLPARQGQPYSALVLLLGCPTPAGTAEGVARELLPTAPETGLLSGSI